MLMALLGEYLLRESHIHKAKFDLGELHYIPTSPESFCNLPRDDGIAYAAQESWVQSETIRVSWYPLHRIFYIDLFQSNIVFGAPFDEERYNKGQD